MRKDVDLVLQTVNDARKRERDAKWLFVHFLILFSNHFSNFIKEQFWIGICGKMFQYFNGVVHITDSENGFFNACMKNKNRCGVLYDTQLDGISAGIGSGFFTRLKNKFHLLKAIDDIGNR